jgi:hypothetical protein
MTLQTPAPPGPRLHAPATTSPPEEEGRRFARRAAVFVLVGLVLYAGLYAASEWLVGQHAFRNRFHMVQTAPHPAYDHVILGASRAAALDYRDMNARLEEMTGSRIINLSTLGGGVTVNRFLLDYFLATRRTSSIVYVLDSFAFHSPQWNEERLGAAELYLRAGWDPALAWRMLREPATRRAAIGYTSGFIKINNQERFAPDVPAVEGAAFDRVYRPVPQIDRQRIEYLYAGVDESTDPGRQPYLEQFEEMILEARSRGIHFTVVRAPVPERFLQMVPGEAEFDRQLEAMLARYRVELHDLRREGNEPEHFYDSDHLNRAGVLALFENHLARLLVPRDSGR